MKKKILFVGDDNLCIMVEHLASQIGFESDSAVISENTPINKTQLEVMRECEIDTRMCGCPSLLNTKQKDAYDYIVALKSNLKWKIQGFKAKLISWDIHCDNSIDGFRFVRDQVKNKLLLLNKREKGESNQKIKIAIVLGTRPEIIKLAQIIKRLDKDEFIIYHTGQHYDQNMGIDFFKKLNLPRDIVRYKGTFDIGESINWLTSCFKTDLPDVVIVQGDTNSVLVGAIAAKKLGIKIAHIGAGLRSKDKRMQENRIIVDHISDYLFAPTENSVDNLTKEGIDINTIFEVGKNVAEKIIAKLKEQDFTKKLIPIKSISAPITDLDQEYKVPETIFEKGVVGELYPKKQIVIFGTLAPWEIVRHGQRIAQIIDHWIKEGHRILYVEPYKSKNPKQYETKNFKLYCFAEDDQWNWWQTVNKNIHKRKVNLIDTLDIWLKAGYQPIVVYEMPLPDYIELLTVFMERNFRIIYELIDKWDGMFLGDKIRVPKVEKYLVDRSDILIGTSTLLVKELMAISGIKGESGDYSSRSDIHLIPNAYNPELFDPKQAGEMPKDMKECLKNGDYKKIVFYMGPVQCEWFDWENYLTLLKAYSDYKFVCIGWNCERDNFTNKDYEKLKAWKNFAFLGRKTHEDCLDYVYHSDICIIPFRDIPMIHATSPNKLFEYLACYKPVINIYNKDFENYPGMSLVKDGKWIDAIKKATKMEINKEEIDKFLSKNTWKDRSTRIMDSYTCHHKELSKIMSYGYMNWSHSRVGEAPKTDKKCSIIMLNLNTSDYTEETINSIQHHTGYPYELIIVDNGSNDKSMDVLKRLKKNKMIDKIVTSNKNLGFAGGNNLGAKEATGDYICFINNDVIVSPKWLTKLIDVFKDEKTGAVGPVSNNVGGLEFPQRVSFTNEKEGIIEEIPRLSGFCIVLRKKVFDKIGGWDDRFFPGFFEDDDLCIRLQEEGYNLKYCGNSFIHHKMQSTFAKNKLDGNKIYMENKARFEQKWKGKYPSVINK